MTRDVPILFSAPMVQAILEGRKTQTRRALKPQPDAGPGGHMVDLGEGEYGLLDGDLSGRWKLRWQPGSRLWVRETWAHYHTINYVVRSGGRAFSEVSDGLVGYRADGHETIEDFRTHIRLMSGLDLEAIEIRDNRWRPSIHMPRWASRITLLVTDVRVQRLQDISEEDAIAEGMKWEGPMPENGMEGLWIAPGTRRGYGPTQADREMEKWASKAREAYRFTWEHINGPGSWDTNPWVAAISFERIGG